MDSKMIAYNKEHYAVMANAIIKGKQEMTLMEARIIRLLITQVVKEDRDLKTYTCRIQDLADFLNVPSGNIYRDIKTICENLLKRIVRIGTGNPKEPWMAFQWVQLARYDGNGNITLKLSEHIAPYVLELNSWFTQYRIENILEFNSFYAIRLYELIKCENGITRDTKDIFTFEIDYLRQLFCCENKFAKNNDFVTKVIEIGVKEINEKSDIELSYECKKTGKKITSIEFSLYFNSKTFMKRRNERLAKEAEES